MLKYLPKSLNISKNGIQKNNQKITLKISPFGSENDPKMEPRGDHEHVTGTWVRHPWTPQGTKHVERRPRDTKISKKVTPKVQKSTKTIPKFMKK
jgi:hypothetical protein